MVRVTFAVTYFRTAGSIRRVHVRPLTKLGEERTVQLSVGSAVSMSLFDEIGPLMFRMY